MSRAQKWGELTGRVDFRQSFFGKTILLVESRSKRGHAHHGGIVISNCVKWFDADLADLMHPSLRWLLETNRGEQ